MRTGARLSVACSWSAVIIPLLRSESHTTTMPSSSRHRTAWRSAVGTSSTAPLSGSGDQCWRQKFFGFDRMIDGFARA